MNSDTQSVYSNIRKSRYNVYNSNYSKFRNLISRKNAEENPNEIDLPSAIHHLPSSTKRTINIDEEIQKNYGSNYNSYKNDNILQELEDSNKNNVNALKNYQLKKLEDAKFDLPVCYEKYSDFADINQIDNRKKENPQKINNLFSDEEPFRKDNYNRIENHRKDFDLNFFGNNNNISHQNNLDNYNIPNRGKEKNWNVEKDYVNVDENFQINKNNFDDFLQNNKNGIPKNKENPVKKDNEIEMLNRKIIELEKKLNLMQTKSENKSIDNLDISCDMDKSFEEDYQNGKLKIRHKYIRNSHMKNSEIVQDILIGDKINENFGNKNNSLYSQNYLKGEKINNTDNFSSNEFLNKYNFNFGENTEIKYDDNMLKIDNIKLMNQSNREKINDPIFSEQTQQPKIYIEPNDSFSNENFNLKRNYINMQDSKNFDSLSNKIISNQIDESMENIPIESFERKQLYEKYPRNSIISKYKKNGEIVTQIIKPPQLVKTYTNLPPLQQNNNNITNFEKDFNTQYLNFHNYPQTSDEQLNLNKKNEDYYQTNNLDNYSHFSNHNNNSNYAKNSFQHLENYSTNNNQNYSLKNIQDYSTNNNQNYSLKNIQDYSTNNNQNYYSTNNNQSDFLKNIKNSEFKDNQNYSLKYIQDYSTNNNQIYSENNFQNQAYLNSKNAKNNNISNSKELNNMNEYYNSKQFHEPSTNQEIIRTNPQRYSITYIKNGKDDKPKILQVSNYEETQLKYSKNFSLKNNSQVSNEENYKRNLNFENSQNLDNRNFEGQKNYLDKNRNSFLNSDFYEGFGKEMKKNDNLDNMKDSQISKNLSGRNSLQFEPFSFKAQENLVYQNRANMR